MILKQEVKPSYTNNLIWIVPKILSLKSRMKSMSLIKISIPKINNSTQVKLF